MLHIASFIAMIVLLAIRGSAQGEITYTCQTALCEGNAAPDTTYLFQVIDYFCSVTLFAGEGQTCYGPSTDGEWEVMNGYAYMYDISNGASYSWVPSQTECTDAYTAIINECFANGAIRGAATLNNFEYALDGCGSIGTCRYSF